MVAGAAGDEQDGARRAASDHLGGGVEGRAAVGEQAAPHRGLLGDLGGHPGAGAGGSEGVHLSSVTSCEASRTAPATGSTSSTRTSTPGRCAATVAPQQGLVDGEPAAEHDRAGIAEPGADRGGQRRERGGRAVDDRVRGRVAVGGQLGDEPGPTRPVAAVGVAVEVVDELVGAGEAAVGDERLGQGVDGLAAVIAAQRVPDGLAGHPPAAALVAEQVAPATGAGLDAAGRDAPGDRAGSRDHRDPVRDAACGEDQPGVVHDVHPRARAAGW